MIRRRDDDDWKSMGTCASSAPLALLLTLRVLCARWREIPALWRETGGSR